MAHVVEIYTNTAEQTIQLVLDDGYTTDIKVGDCQIAIGGNLCYLIAAGRTWVLNYVVITVPAEANANDLYSALLLMLQETGGGGDATAANQLTEINRLTSIRDYLFNTAAGKSAAQLLYNNASAKSAADILELIRIANNSLIQQKNTPFIELIPFEAAATMTDLRDAIEVWRAATTKSIVSVAVTGDVINGYAALVTASVVIV